MPLTVRAEWAQRVAIQPAPDDGRALLILGGTHGAVAVDLDTTSEGRPSMRQQLLDALLAGCKREAPPIAIHLNLEGLRMQGIGRSTSRVIRDENGDIAGLETDDSSYSKLDR